MIDRKDWASTGAVMKFPKGLTIANGRFELRELVRGEELEGLWLAADSDRQGVAWVTLRRVRQNAQRTRILTFASFGIEAPLFVGVPDIEEK